MSAAAGWSAWKAIDETLARPVAVLTFTPGFAGITAAVTAARAAGRLTDTRLVQVFDVEEDWGHAYVVMEWVAGDSLEDLLAEGPLEPGLAAEITAQTAEALASAHAAGLAHLCLVPRSVYWTPGGGVKVLGTGLDAALAGQTADDPARTDTQGLGKLLYAALTAHWPGTGCPALPPAPEVDGHPRSPRQVRAGVPAAIDDITCRALLPDRPPGQAITSPAAFAAVLDKVLPDVAPPSVPPSSGFAGPVHAGPGAPYWEPPPGGRRGQRAPRGRQSYPPGPGGRRRSAAGRTLAAVVIVLVLATAALGGWAYLHRTQRTRPAVRHTHHRAPTAGAAHSLAPVRALGFDPQSSLAEDSGNENSNEAQYAIDASPATAWHTQWYATAKFGGTKTGAGLILDMGRPVRLSQVRVTFGSAPGANVRIELGNSDTRSRATLHTFTMVARATGTDGTHTFRVASTATGRYVLIWFTRLPLNANGHYEADVYNVSVKGSH